MMIGCAEGESAAKFAALLHDPQMVTTRAELKWLAGELGPARELELLVQRVAPMKRPALARYAIAFARNRSTA
jgi:hypothetical protein